MKATEIVLVVEKSVCSCGKSYTIPHEPMICYDKSRKTRITVPMKAFSDTLPRRLIETRTTRVTCPACFDEAGDKQLLLFPAHVIYPGVDEYEKLSKYLAQPPKADKKASIDNNNKPKKVKAFTDEELFAL